MINFKLGIGFLLLGKMLYVNVVTLFFKSYPMYLRKNVVCKSCNTFL